VCVLVVKNCLSNREECSSSDKVITLFYIVYIRLGEGGAGGGGGSVCVFLIPFSPDHLSFSCRRQWLALQDAQDNRRRRLPDVYLIFSVIEPRP